MDVIGVQDSHAGAIQKLIVVVDEGKHVCHPKFGRIRVAGPKWKRRACLDAVVWVTRHGHKDCRFESQISEALCIHQVPEKKAGQKDQRAAEVFVDLGRIMPGSTCWRGNKPPEIGKRSTKATFGGHGSPGLMPDVTESCALCQELPQFACQRRTCPQNSSRSTSKRLIRWMVAGRLHCIYANHDHTDKGVQLLRCGRA